MSEKKTSLTSGEISLDLRAVHLQMDVSDSRLESRIETRISHSNKWKSWDAKKNHQVLRLQHVTWLYLGSLWAVLGI